MSINAIWLASACVVVFDWLTHALPLEKLKMFQLSPQATQRNILWNVLHTIPPELVEWCKTPYFEYYCAFHRWPRYRIASMYCVITTVISCLLTAVYTLTLLNFCSPVVNTCVPYTGECISFFYLLTYLLTESEVTKTHTQSHSVFNNDKVRGVVYSWQTV